MAIGGLAPATLFDFTAGSTSSGVLNSVTFSYSAFPCPSAVKIKFFRALGVAARYLTERGPYDVTQALQTVTLSPPVAVQAGDWIAITKLSECGSPLAAAGGSDSLAMFPGDVKSDVIIDSFNLTSGLTLSLLGSGSRTPLNGVAAVIPVAYEGPGLAGSFFRTETQLSNPTSTLAEGWIVYVVRRITGIDLNGPAFARYALAPFETRTVNLVSLFGSLDLGNVDLIPTTGASPPATVHVFNDLGPSGTLGFVAPEVSVSQMLATGERGVLLGPSDVANYRFNIGFRGAPSAHVFVAPANLLLTLRDSEGAVLAMKSQAAGILVQVSAEDLFGVRLPSNALVTCDVASGTAVVYGVTADNRTNDISYQLAHKAPLP